MNFEDFNLDGQIQEGINAMRFKSPTPIQEQAIPIILKGRDLIACAQTGTGKTAAFLLPILHKIKNSPEKKSTRALIIAPTRELAIQIDQQVSGLAYFTGASSLAVYGGNDGMSFEREKKALIDNADIIVATPGRLSSHLSLGYVDFSELDFLVLDEADRMLDMGFYDDIMQIIGHLPKKRQTLLFSATMPPKIRELTSKILNNPEQISIAISKPAEGIIQGAYVMYEEQKIPLIKELLKEKKLDSVLIFSSTKSNVKKTEQTLKQQGLSAKAIHSDLEQNEREEVMREFKNRKIQILVATDIVSRGIDVEGIDLVINFDVPGDAEDYIHRIGRTARAATTGVALTFITPMDQHKFVKIEELLGKPVHKIPLPPDIGQGPIYNPSENKPSFQRRGSSGGNRRPMGKRR